MISLMSRSSIAVSYALLVCSFFMSSWESAKYKGNLPFTATKESLVQHFTKVKPSSIRLPTSKGTGISKGYAFLEFDTYDRMQTSLQSYHHSTFNDRLSTARRINVELTWVNYNIMFVILCMLNLISAGGGGSKSQGRKLKLRSKNLKLKEERKKRTIDADEELRQSASSGRKSETLKSLANGNVHPSRQNIVSAL